MSLNSLIEWLVGPDGRRGMTWNPQIGCWRKTAGCDSCYAINTAWIRMHNPHPKIAEAYAGTVEMTDHGLDWTGRVNLLDDRLDKPLHILISTYIFVTSVSDVFHPNVTEEFIAEEFAVMALAYWHVFFLLTKHHARMATLLASQRFRDLYQAAYTRRLGELRARLGKRREWPGEAPWPLANLRLGVSVENQPAAGMRIPWLLRARGAAAVLWISVEPLLGPVDLSPWLFPEPGKCNCGEGHTAGGHAPWCGRELSLIDWVVAGGESGRLRKKNGDYDCRPLHPDWLRSLRGQCQDAGVPFFLKQRGSWTWEWSPDQLGEPREPDLYVHADGRLADEAMALADGGAWKGVWYVGKHAAGRELDGREWVEHPETATA